MSTLTSKTSDKIKEADMSISTSKIAMCGLLFLFTLVSGVWLSHSGKPFNGVIFSVHKLTALATVIIIGVNVRHLYSAMDARALVALSVIVVSGLLFLALFISGALLSLELSVPEAILKTHHVAPLLAVVSSTITLYLLAAGNA